MARFERVVEDRFVQCSIECLPATLSLKTGDFQRRCALLCFARLSHAWLLYHTHLHPTPLSFRSLTAPTESTAYKSHELPGSSHASIDISMKLNSPHNRRPRVTLRVAQVDDQGQVAVVDGHAGEVEEAGDALLECRYVSMRQWVAVGEGGGYGTFDSSERAREGIVMRRDEAWLVQLMGERCSSKSDAASLPFAKGGALTREEPQSRHFAKT